MSSTTVIRAKDWLFHTLWAAALPSLRSSILPPSEDSTAYHPSPYTSVLKDENFNSTTLTNGHQWSCELEIPLTALFVDGQPTKVMGTDYTTHRVCRVDLDRIAVSGHDYLTLRGSDMRQIRALRHLLELFVTSRDYDANQKNTEDIFLFRAIYVDGQVEDIALSKVDLLLRSNSWRVQLLMIQAYVPAVSTYTGLFSTQTMVTSKLDERASPAADSYARTLAQYFERIALQRPAALGLVGSNVTSTTTATGGNKSAVRLKITSLQCVFVGDPSGRVIFLYTEAVTAELDDRHCRQVEGSLRADKAGREASAAESVAKQLSKLLLSAAARGLSTAESFAHFDVHGTGYFDVSGLLDGLARLGIGVTLPVAQGVLSEIGGISAAFVTFNDFSKFLQNAKVEESQRHAITNPSSMINDEIDPVAEEERKIRQEYALRQRRALFPPGKPSAKLTAAFDLKITQVRDFDDQDTSQQSLNGESHLMTSAHPIQMELPLPEAMYRTTPMTKSELAALGMPPNTKGIAAAGHPIRDEPPPIKTKKRKPTNDNPASSEQLPVWATKRTKRALKQMSANFDRTIRARAQNTSLQTAENPSQMLAGDSQHVRDRPNIVSKLKLDGLTSDSSEVKDGSIDEETEKSDQDDQDSFLDNDTVDDNSIVSHNANVQTNSIDEVLHVGEGVIMTYRVIDGDGLTDLKGKPQPKSDTFRALASLEKREAALFETLHEEEDGDDNDDWKRVAVTLVVVPDITMTLDTLEKYLSDLRRKAPYVRIVLVGLIGLPHTVWPSRWVLTPELQSKCVLHLINHLWSVTSAADEKEEVSSEQNEEKGAITSSSDESNTGLFFNVAGISLNDRKRHWILAGIGTGAFYASRFAMEGLPHMAQPLVNSLRQFVSLNGFLKPPSRFLQLCRDMRTTLLTASVAEASALLTALLLYDVNTTDGDGRKDAQKRFWETRRAWQKPSLAAPIGQNLRVVDAGFGGLLAQLRGIILSSADNFDGSVLLSTSRLPIVVVQATEDVFVAPTAAAIYAPTMLPPGRELIESIDKSADLGAVYVAWIRAGHEILQERSPYVCGLLASLTAACGIPTKVRRKKYGLPLPSAFDEAMGFVTRASETRIAEEDMNKEEPAVVSEVVDDFDFDLASIGSFQGHSSEVVTKEDDQTSDDLDKLDRDEAAITTRIANDVQTTSDEQGWRAALQAERLRQQEAMTRAQEKEGYALREFEEAQRIAEREERRRMLEEEKRSRDYAATLAVADLCRASATLAREKAATLRWLRQEEATQRVEEELARQRSKRIEERRREAQALLKRIANEEDLLRHLSAAVTGPAEALAARLAAGDHSGGAEVNAQYAMPSDALKDVSAAVDASQRLLRDWLDLRASYLDAIRRQRVLQTKAEIGVKQAASLENEERRLRRAIRLLEANPRLVGADMDAGARLAEMRSSLSAKQNSLQELSSIATERRSRLYVASRQVQLLKLIVRDKELRLAQRLRQLDAYSSALNKRISVVRMSQESVASEREVVRGALRTVEARHARVMKELARVKAHKGRMIDTTVWMDGVQQRANTAVLRKYLADEVATLGKEIQTVQLTLIDLRRRLADWSEQAAQLRRDADKFGRTATLLRSVYEDCASVDIETLLAAMDRLSLRAEMLESMREKELVAITATHAAIAAENEANGGDVSSTSSVVSKQKNVNSEYANLGIKILPEAVERIRYKDPESRTVEEKQFVAIDLLLCPGAYANLTSLEADLMMMDGDYHSTLTATDLKRIAALPATINLALPFMHNAEEVAAHRLLNRFLRGKDDAFFRTLDAHSQTVNSVHYPTMNNKHVSSQKLISNIGAVDSGAGREIKLGTVSQTREAFSDLMIVVKDTLPALFGQRKPVAEMETAALDNSDGKKRTIADRLLGSSVDAEAVHAVLVRQALRDRLRFKFNDESITTEERHWQEIDRILSPSAYGDDLSANDLSLSANGATEAAAVATRATAAPTALTEKDVSEIAALTSNRRPVESLVHTAHRTLTVPGTDRSTSQVARPEVLGDVYVPLIEATNRGEDVFGDQWHCTLTPTELLNLAVAPVAEVTKMSAEKKYIRKLLDKYYVHEAETLLGAASLRFMLASTGRLVAALRRIDKRSDDALASIKKERQSIDEEEKKIVSSQVTNVNLAEAGEVDIHDEGWKPVPHLDLTETAAVTDALLDAHHQNLNVIPEDSSALLQRTESCASLGSALSEDTGADVELPRVWGSWDVVNPASAGLASQRTLFSGAVFDPKRDHPAAYAVTMPLATVLADGLDSDDDSILSSEDESDLGDAESIIRADAAAIAAMDTTAAAKDLDAALTTLLSATPNANAVVGTRGKRRRGAVTGTTTQRRLFHFVPSLEVLAATDPRRTVGRIILLRMEEPLTLYTTSQEQTLDARQSRAHVFTVPDDDSARITEMTVTVVFKGSFTTAGYRLGRLAASLFRLPEGVSANDGGSLLSPPIPVGYAPYDAVSLNTTTSSGRVAIRHAPLVVPIEPGSFQVVIGAASRVAYSISVTARYATAAAPIVAKAVAAARAAQARLPQLHLEADAIAESLRLAERKLGIASALLTEAELESQRCAAGVTACQAALAKDDDEAVLLAEERRALAREVDIFETEYAQWTARFSARVREKHAIREAITAMQKFSADRVNEKRAIAESLSAARRDLPASVRLLHGTAAAVQTAVALNASLSGADGGTENGGGDGGRVGDQFDEFTDSSGGVRMKLFTPAESVRRVYQQYGWEALSLEEQRWTLLDKALRPHKYEWLREAEEAERIERQQRGLPPKKTIISPAAEPFRLVRAEVEHILSTPFALLSRTEAAARKLLTKYHDDAEALAASHRAGGEFDPNLAPAVRAKPRNTYTQEEKEWASVDEILNPDVWRYYVRKQDNQHDRNKRESLKFGSESRRGKRGKQWSTSPQRTLRTDENKTSVTSPTGDDQSITSADSSQISGALSTNEAEAALARLRLQNTALALLPATATRAPIGKRVGDAGYEWKCPYNRAALLAIWRSSKESLNDDSARHTQRLLLKYNGSYTAYVDNERGALERKNRILTMGKIRWDRAAEVLSLDPDTRARQLLNEIDRTRAATATGGLVHSALLHGQPQRYPAAVLLLHLERSLDELLTTQIRERERTEASRYAASRQAEEDEAKLAELPVTKELTNGTYIPAETRQWIDSKNSASTAATSYPSAYGKMAKRAAQRATRRVKTATVSEEIQILTAKQRVAEMNSKSSRVLEDLALQSRLGANACLACRSKHCHWTSSVDHPACEARSKILRDELERVRLDRHAAVIESTIPLSTQNGGNRVFRRQDLVDELTNELSAIKRYTEMDAIDRELHNAYDCRKEYFESRHLHGYAILLWTANARAALERRQQRLIAGIVAHEVVDGILDNMLDGWIFGETPATQSRAAGFVPSLRHDPHYGAHGKITSDSTSVIRAGSDQRVTAVSVIEKLKKRAEDRRNGLQTAEQRRGSVIEKAAEDVEPTSTERNMKMTVARGQNSHAVLLDETERTLRFGLFLLALMYFRAAVFIRREQKSWGEEPDDMASVIADSAAGGTRKTRKKLTEARIAMLDEEHRVRLRQKKIQLILARAKVGDARRHEREAAERKEAIQRLQAVVRRQKLELQAIEIIQKVYRGHLGRKAARRWALKRAELGAMNSLLTSAAIAIQRIYRGYSTRQYARYKRMEMAQFIALMRVQETQQDEEMYWQTHPWSRWKREQRAKFGERFDKIFGKVIGGRKVDADDALRVEKETMDQIRREVEALDGTDIKFSADTEEDNNVVENDFALDNEAISRRISFLSARSSFSEK